ncbi:MAG: ubiquinol-cytochrome c reductase iron-sulfur subunit [Actinomycetota bacterium]|nr:ubiquinol-cytochrome c reductase iron-sulfur subunit [Actinomycetota bacterium]
MSDRSPRRSVKSIVLALLLSIASSVGLVILYVRGGQPQLEGSLIAVSLGGLAYAFIAWAHRLLPGGRFVQEREPHRSSASDRRSLDRDVDATEELIERRGLLAGLLAGAAGVLGIAALLPIRSLGSAPGESLLATAWKKGSRVVGEDGSLVTDLTLDVGGILTVFPEGSVGRADSQVVLVRVNLDDFQALPGRENWSPQGYVAYSKICTHAGCPVGLYQPETRELFCPCHQSVFDVADGARPTSGPAARPLPQLPLEIDAEGQLRASGGFSAPVGPSFWSEK